MSHEMPPAGTILSKTSKGMTAQATVMEDGQISYGGIAYKSLSAAAIVAAKAIGLKATTQDGWAFWGLKKTGDGTQRVPRAPKVDPPSMELPLAPVGFSLPGAPPALATPTPVAAPIVLPPAPPEECDHKAGLVRTDDGNWRCSLCDTVLMVMKAVTPVAEKSDCGCADCCGDCGCSTENEPVAESSDVPLTSSELINKYAALQVEGGNRVDGVSAAIQASLDSLNTTPLAEALESLLKDDRLDRAVPEIQDVLTEIKNERPCITEPTPEQVAKAEKQVKDYFDRVGAVLEPGPVIMSEDQAGDGTEVVSLDHYRNVVDERDAAVEALADFKSSVIDKLNELCKWEVSCAADNFDLDVMMTAAIRQIKEYIIDDIENDTNELKDEIKALLLKLGMTQHEWGLSKRTIV